MEPTIKLELSVAEVNTLLAGLAELPFKASSDLIQKLRVTALSQMAPAAAEAPADKKEK
jgi:hypothetical protein